MRECFGIWTSNLSNFHIMINIKTRDQDEKTSMKIKRKYLYLPQKTPPSGGTLPFQSSPSNGQVFQ